jgi:hypothetical protein
MVLPSLHRPTDDMTDDMINDMTNDTTNDMTNDVTNDVTSDGISDRRIAETQQSRVHSSQSLVPSRARSTDREAGEHFASTPEDLETPPCPKELTPSKSEWPELPDLHRELKNAISEDDVSKIAKLQRDLVNSTAAARTRAESEAQLRTASYQNVFDYMIPGGMIEALNHELALDFRTKLYKDHTDLVETQRSTRTRRAYRQRMILAKFKHSAAVSDSGDDDFFEFAMAYAFFEQGERFWASFWKLVKIHERWSVVLPLLRKHFFYFHCDNNDWEAVAKKPVGKYFTPTDIDKVYERGFDPDQMDPCQNDDLRQNLSLKFDRFGVVDPIRCWEAMSDAITSDLRTWRETHPGLVVPRFSKRLQITASEQVQAAKVTAHRNVESDHEAHAARLLDGTSEAEINVPLRRSARSTLPTTTSAKQMPAFSSTTSATNVHPVTSTPQKRTLGTKKTGSVRKKAKYTRPAMDNRKEVQTSDNEDEGNGDDDDDEMLEGERRPETHLRASNPQTSLEYMSESERELYRTSCHNLATLFRETARFIDLWIEQAHNTQERNQGFDELEHDLISFEEVKALVSEDGHKLATEWRVQGCLTREIFDRALDARQSAGVWCLTNTQACVLMELGVRIERPVVVRSKEHFCSLSNFLCLLEQRYTLDGELAVQDRTGINPATNMRLGEVLQRLSLEPDPTDPLSFRPLNCLDIAAFRPYTSVPAAMQHRRFSIVEAMQSFQSQEANIKIKPGKQSTIRARPTKSSVRAIDMESCAAFMLLASVLAFSTWHEDLLNNTWVQCLTGKKAWFMRVNDDEGPPAVVILEPGDWLLMPAGLRVKHAVLTLEGPSLMVGGQHLDGHCLTPQLDEMSELIENPDRTNEAVPALQLPIMLDLIIDYISKYPEDHRLFVLAGAPGNHPRLVEGLQDWRDKAKAKYGCTCHSDGRSKCIPGKCPCLTRSSNGGNFTRRCTTWCAGNYHANLIDVDTDGSCFFDRACEENV